MNSINLPEELVLLVAAGAGLGIVVGRWPVLVAASATLSIAAFLPSDSTDEGWALICVVYLPVAASSLAAGVGLRRLVASGRKRVLNGRAG